MIARELRGARWKLIIAAVGAVPAVLIVAAYLPPYETTGRIVERFTDEAALGHILNVYGGGGVALALLAILLGALTVAEEVGRGTIYLLLSKPISRTRVLLTKYAISAGILLSAAVFGHAVLIVAAVARGYPPGLLSAYGAVLSTALMWLGSLSVLGMAIIFSVLCRHALVSAAATFVAAYLILYVLPGYAELIVPYDILERVAPLYSWTSAALYAGDGLALLNFIACFAVAAVLLATLLWLFRRKAF
ncbi:MAG: ABC transporter permease [Rubrobacter sp.]